MWVTFLWMHIVSKTGDLCPLRAAELGWDTDNPGWQLKNPGRQVYNPGRQLQKPWTARKQPWTAAAKTHNGR